MRYARLLSALDRAGLSPERAARELGVSGMTLRRWRDKPRNEQLPEIYRLAIAPLLRRLVGEGILHPEDPDVVAAFVSAEDPFQKTLRDFGITNEALRSPGESRDVVAKGLARIGENEHRQDQVRNSGRMLAHFKAMGEEWRGRIDDLMLALRSHEIAILDKFVAFGALFYLITPFDQIPDYIPVIGLSDDFIVLGIAVLYYHRRFPHLFRGRARKQDKGDGLSQSKRI
ncbi:MAG: YkvA family protein [Elusimicrobia bacterium]|nr:YkvA family protein [Elusimicrobiota bacterium]